MAKQKMVKIEHKDSFHTEEMTREEFDGLQPRIQSKYTIKREYEAADAPAEVAKGK